MPKGKRGKLKDKWREKQWIAVHAPSSFSSSPVSYIPVTDEARAPGRIVETTLYDILKQDPQQYNVKLYFQLTEVKGNIASSILKGHEYSREFMKSLIRRGSSMVDLIKDYATKDQGRVRVYASMFTQRKINSSRKHALRAAADSVLNEKASNLTYDQFSHEAVQEEIGADIRTAAAKIVHLRHVGIRKTKLLVPPRELSTPNSSEEQIVQPV